MPTKKKGGKVKTTTHSNKNKNTVIVNVGTGGSKSSVSKKGVKSFTKGTSYTGKATPRSANLPNSTTVINNMPSPAMFPSMDTNRLNAIENSINNIGTDVQALHGRINRPSRDEVKSYIPSSIDSMRTQLASSAESRISDMETSTPHMHNQITHVLPHAQPMSIDSTQPVPMSINTSQQSSSMSTAQFGGSDDSSGGGGGGGYPPNSPSVQTASTPVRSIDMVRLDRENSNASAGSRVSDTSVKITGEKLGKLITKKEESPKAESDYSFDTPKPTDYDLSPVVGQSYEDMEQSFSGKKMKNEPNSAKSSQGSYSASNKKQKSPQSKEETSQWEAYLNVVGKEYDDIKAQLTTDLQKKGLTKKDVKRIKSQYRDKLIPIFKQLYPKRRDVPTKFDTLDNHVQKKLTW